MSASEGEPADEERGRRARPFSAVATESNASRRSMMGAHVAREEPAVSMTSAEAGPFGATNWERRFRASAIYFSEIAIDAPEIGLVTTNAGGLAQLYRWDTTTNELTQLTHEPTGRLLGRLSPDGRWAAFLRDADGNEIGHWAVVPMAGGDEVDLTPGIAAYASEEIAFSRAGSRVGMITASDDRFAVRVGTIGATGTVSD